MSEGDRREDADALAETVAPAPGTGTLPGPAEPPRPAEVRGPAQTAMSLAGRDVGNLHTLPGPAAREDAAPHAATLPGPHTIVDLPALPHVDAASYSIGAEIARGGMGKILSARDRRLRRDVVIKVGRQSAGEIDPRFEREALITARLQHPSIVRVYEAGVLADGRAFYAMERVRGRSLEVIIDETKSLRDRLALLPHAIAVVDAIAYAHSEGVLHRDLKPANVLIGPFGETVVIDWGLAKDLRATEAPQSTDRKLAVPSSSDSGLTQVGSVMGTPSYMAPEQARGDSSDERTDIYALGALLYVLFTGVAPHHGRTTAEVLDLVATGRRIPITEREPTLPPELATIVEHAMAFERGDRFASAKDLADELRRFAAGKLVASHSYSPWVLLRRWLWRHRITVGVAAFAMVALAVIGVLAVRSIVHERDVAAAARVDADAQRKAAQEFMREAVRKHDEMLLGLAQGAVSDDPSRAAAYIPGMSDGMLTDERTQQVLRVAMSRGLARILGGHHADVELIAHTPDGKYLISGSDDATLRIWDLATEQSRELAGHVGPIEAIQISDDGAFVASAGTDGDVRLWEIATASGRKLAGHRMTVRGLAFSPDGKHLASTSEDGTLWVWDTTTATGKQLFKHTHGLRPIVWTRDNVVIVGGFDGKIGHFDPVTGKGAMTGDGVELRCFALSSDGKYLASGDENGIVTLWTADGKRIKTLATHTDVVRNVVFTPDGKHLVSAGGDKHVWRYEIPSGAYIDLGGNGDGVKGLDVSPDGKLVASAGIDGTARVWSIDGPSLQVFKGHGTAVKGVTFTLDRRLASGAEDDHVRVWRLDPDRAPPAGPALRAWIKQQTNFLVDNELTPN